MKPLEYTLCKANRARRGLLLRHRCKEGALRQQTVSVREDDGWTNSAPLMTKISAGLSVFPCSSPLSLSNFILRYFIIEPRLQARNKTYFFLRPWEILLMTKSEMTERLFISVHHHQTRFPSTDWPNIYEEKFWQATARQRTDGSWYSFTPSSVQQNSPPTTCAHASTQQTCDWCQPRKPHTKTLQIMFWKVVWKLSLCKYKGTHIQQCQNVFRIWNFLSF